MDQSRVPGGGPGKARPKRQGRNCFCGLHYEEWLGRLFLLGHGSSLQVIHRFILNPTTEPVTVLTPCTARRHLFIPSIHLQSPTPRFGLIWYTGQAWICILDLVKNQLEHTIDLTLLCRRPHRGNDTACVCCADRSTSPPFLPRCMLGLGARIRRHRLVTSRIRAFHTFPLIHEAPPSTPCLVCMLARPKVYFARAPFETRIRSSLVKSGL